MQQHFEIIGTGLYLPQNRLTAEQVDARAGRPPGWTRQHIGVHFRHECVAPESLASMACHSVQQAMAEADVDWSQIDLIIDASTSRHQPIPCNAASLQRAFGPAAAGIPCFDVQTTCLGFIVALNIINGLFATGHYRHILLVTSEAPLLAVNWKESESACLMGDGSASAVLRRHSDSDARCFFAHQTFSAHLDSCQVRAGSHDYPPWKWTPQNDADFRFHMDGRQLLRAVRQHLPAMVDSLIRESGVARSDLHVLPHQAAPRALALVRSLLGFTPERFEDQAVDMGNLVAASVPAIVHRCRQKRIVVPGTPVLLLGTSAGYSQAGMIMRI